MSTITKNAGGNVIFTDGNGVPHSFTPRANVLPHPQIANMILIHESTSNQDIEAAFTINISLLTAPTFADRNELINLLSTDYFKESSATVTIAGFSTEAKQIEIKTLLSNGLQITQIGNATQIAEIVAGAASGKKGLRVYIGPTDPISDLPVIMSYDHHQIHEGETFRSSFLLASLANNASKDILIIVPNITVPNGVNPIALMPHFRFESVAALDSTVQLFELPTSTANGMAKTPVALERNGTYTPKLQLFEDPTITAPGNLIWQGITTVYKNAASNINDSSNEFILKNNTAYLLRTTSNQNSNRVLIRFLWYEDLGV